MKWFVTIVICIAVFEIIEHLGLPLVWALGTRKRRAVTGASAMIGKPCVVRQWRNTRGKVAYHSELWQAESGTVLLPGSEAVIVAVRGLTLYVEPAGGKVEPLDASGRVGRM